MTKYNARWTKSTDIGSYSVAHRLIDFSQSAQNIHFSFEGADNVPILRASLQTADGEWRDADVNLAERVENIDGRFEYSKASKNSCNVLCINHTKQGKHGMGRWLLEVQVEGQ